MSCEACTKGRTGVWRGSYVASCTGCNARLIARSLAAFHAWHPMGSKDVEALREMVGRLLPTLTPKQAKQAIREWWDFDQQQISKSRPRSAWMDE